MKHRLFLVLLLIGFVPGFLMVPATMAHAKDHGDDHGNGHGNKHDHEERGDHGDEDGGHGRHHGGGRYLRDSDYGMLQQYYAGPRDLPPGLRKKYYRTGALPPGWQKRFQPMPFVLVQQLPPVPVYYERGYIDGYAVVYDRRTRIIVDSIDLFGAITGR